MYCFYERMFIYLLSFYYTVLFCGRLLLLFITGKKFWKVKCRKIAPEKVSKPEVGQHSYIQLKNSGLKLHYVEAGDKSKKLMVFMHGFPEFWYSWRHQLKEFSKNYWCVAVDLRGYGESGKPKNVTDYQIHIIAEDIKELVHALGRTTFIMIAHDWGGAAGWSFLDNYPEMVEKYVIMNAPHKQAFDELIKTDSSQFWKAWYMIFFQMPYFPELFVKMNDFEFMENIFTFASDLSHKNEDLEAFKYVFSQPGALTPPINYYRNIFTSKPTTKRYSDIIEPPGLFLFGESDVALSTKYTEIMPKLFSNLKSEIIKNAGHFVQQDNPVAVNNAIRKFLSE